MLNKKILISIKCGEKYCNSCLYLENIGCGRKICKIFQISFIPESKKINRLEICKQSEIVNN